MLFFADVSIFARPPVKTRRSHLNDIIFLNLAVFWLLFGTLKGPNGFLRSWFQDQGHKTLKLIWKIPQKY